MTFLTKPIATLVPFTTKTTNDAAISLFCLLSQMALGFTRHRTWVEIVTPTSSTSMSSCICSRPPVPSPMFCTRGTAWIFSLSQDWFSLTSTTTLSTVPAAVMMMSRYPRAIFAVAFWCLLVVIAPLAFFLAFMILMSARACWWKSALLIANAISGSILLGGGTLSSLHKMRRLSAMLDLVVGAGPGLQGTFWLRIRGWTVSHLLAGTGGGLGLGLGSCRGSGCSVNCSLGLGWCCCCSSWRFSGSPSCVAPACCEASRPPPSRLVVSSLPSFLTSRAGAASCTLALASISAVMCAMPVPHSTLSLWRSSHFLYLSSSLSLMLTKCTSSRAAFACSILAILSIVWCSWAT